MGAKVSGSKTFGLRSREELLSLDGATKGMKPRPRWGVVVKNGQSDHLWPLG